MRRLALLVSVLAVVCGAPAVARAAGVYVALGDSYTSAPLVPNQHGTPLDCGRSDHNYPSLVAAQIMPAVFRDVSCGSATTKDMTQPQTGLPLGGTNPPQFNALSADTTLVTIGIGGNDADLVGIAESCIKYDYLTPTGSPCKNHYTVNGVDQAAAKVDAIAPKIDSTLQGIHAHSPRARVLLVGYPAVLPLSGPGCWPMVPLSSGDVPWFRSLLVRINGVLAREAAANRAEYVDTYTGSAGHDVCQLPPNRWFEGVVPTMPAYPLHPNALGEASMARSVLARLALPPPPASSTTASPELRITRWRLHGHKLIVFGTINRAYRGRIVVTFVADRHHHRILRHRRVVVRHGHWRIAFKLPRHRRVAPGRISATSRAQQGFGAGSTSVRTRR